jgi:hypothetical protein
MRLSVVEKHHQVKWIPGQQLYGRMIPRPEPDFQVHKTEAVVQERLLKMIQDRVRHIKDAEGIWECERQELRKLGVVANTPMSFGYEVVPLRDDNLGHEEADGDHAKEKKNRSVRFTVQLMSDKKEFVGARESDHVMIECDGDTTYCISDNYGGEEGLEIIGLGRYSTMADSMDGLEDEEILLSECRESLTGPYSRGLSKVLACGASSQVAFYQPLDPEHGVKSKEE